ncbi:MAG: O-methyltransferase, partial [Ignavibacteriaceae bacterium]
DLLKFPLYTEILKFNFNYYYFLIMSEILPPSQEQYLLKLRTENDPLILEMEEYAKEYKIPILSWQSVEFLEQMIRISKPKRVLEIGTAIAYSTIRIARNLKKKAVVHTIEKSEDNIEKAREYIQKSGLEEKISLFYGDALSIVPQLKKKYDFIFLDADKEDYKRLFDYSLVLLKKGGIVFIDNLLWHGYAASKRVPQNFKASTKHIRDFNLVFASQENLKTSILPIGDGIGVGVKC